MYIHVASVYTHTYIQINLFSKNLYIVPIDCIKLSDSLMLNMIYQIKNEQQKLKMNELY